MGWESFTNKGENGETYSAVPWMMKAVCFAQISKNKKTVTSCFRQIIGQFRNLSGALSGYCQTGIGTAAFPRLELDLPAVPSTELAHDGEPQTAASGGLIA